MEAGSNDLTDPLRLLSPTFFCPFVRGDIRALAEPAGDLRAALHALLPPEDVAAVHDADHMLSFAVHVRACIAQPIEVRDLDGHRLVFVLSQALFSRAPDGRCALHVWRRDHDGAWRLAPADLCEAPIDDQPGTSLWADSLCELLASEAAERSGEPLRAMAWAGWAWQEIRRAAVSGPALRRLRSMIRGALGPDPEVRRMLRLRRRFAAVDRWSMAQHEDERRWLPVTQRLEREAPALLPLYWAFRGKTCFDPGLDPKQALQRIARLRGLKPAQWRSLANGGRRALAQQAAIRREFLGEGEHEDAVEHLELLRLMEPRRRLSTEVWRQVLSLFGTRRSKRRGYADGFMAYAESLRHVVRLVERREAAGERADADGELHAILAWIADRRIARFERNQRRGGWGWLVAQAERHRTLQQRIADRPDGAWDAALAERSIDGLRVVPLDSAAKVWEEAVAMRHCADRYIGPCRDGDSRLFSLRRPTGKRVATARLTRCPDGSWQLEELAGKANARPGVAAFRVAERVAALATPSSDDDRGWAGRLLPWSHAVLAGVISDRR